MAVKMEAQFSINADSLAWIMAAAWGPFCIKSWATHACTSRMHHWYGSRYWGSPISVLCSISSCDGDHGRRRWLFTVTLRSAALRGVGRPTTVSNPLTNVGWAVGPR